MFRILVLYIICTITDGKYFLKKPYAFYFTSLTLVFKTNFHIANSRTVSSRSIEFRIIKNLSLYKSTAKNSTFKS